MSGCRFQPAGGLKERGVEFPAEVSEHPWGRVASKDSEGNDVRLYEPPEN